MTNKWPTAESMNKSIAKHINDKAEEKANERIKNVYQYIIDGLRVAALAHEVEAAKVNIFDTVKLTSLAKVRALREGATLVEKYRDTAFPPPPEVSKTFSRIDNLDPNITDPFNEQNS